MSVSLVVRNKLLGIKNISEIVQHWFWNRRRRKHDENDLYDEIYKSWKAFLCCCRLRSSHRCRSRHFWRRLRMHTAYNGWHLNEGCNGLSRVITRHSFYFICISPMATAGSCFTGITHKTRIKFHERVSITKALVVMVAVVMRMRKIWEATIKTRSKQAVASLISSCGLYVIAFVITINFQYRLHKYYEFVAFSDCLFMIKYFCEYVYINPRPC